jgi:hypothetical protein
VLEAALAGVRRFGVRHGRRYVPGERNAAPSGLLGDREVHLPRETAVYLEVANAAIDQRIHHPARVGSRREHEAVRLDRRLAAEQGASSNDARSHERAGGSRDGPSANLRVVREIGGHVAHTRHTVRYEGREEHLAVVGVLSRRIHPIAEEVDVHVPQPGNEELSTSVDHTRVRRHRDARRRAGESDPATAHDDRLRGQTPSRGDVDDGDTRDGDGCSVARWCVLRSNGC